MAEVNHMKLGRAEIDADGNLRGRIYALGLGPFDISTVKATSIKNETYFKLMADPNGDNFEIGAVFPKEKNGVKYYSASLKSPFLDKPINAAFFPDRKNPGSFLLIWNKAEPKPAAEADTKATGAKAEAAPQPEPQAEPELNMALPATAASSRAKPAVNDKNATQQQKGRRLASMTP